VLAEVSELESCGAVDARLSKLRHASQGQNACGVGWSM